jgi:hypothetical protein
MKPKWRALGKPSGKRMGAGLVFFFAIKGMLWLALPVLMAAIAR